MTQSNTGPDISPAIPPAEKTENLSPDTQALLHLHKMSMTAGLGSGDYVAINLLSVVSVMFGLASLLALMDHIMVIIPMAGIVLAIVSLRQIHHSNGTQTGQLAAWAGLALCVLIGGGILTSEAVWYFQTSQDRAQIKQLVQRLSDDLRENKYDDAYDLFDRKFKDRINKKDFIAHLNAIENNPQVPSIDNLKAGSIAVDIDKATERRKAETALIPHFKGWAGITDDRLDASFADTESAGWKIAAIPAFFTSKQHSAPPGANLPGGAPPGAN